MSQVVVETTSVALLEPSTEALLTAGGSATQFVFDMPGGARCPGDSASGGYRVQGFMLPSTTPLSNVHFSTSGPSSGLPLFAMGSPLIDHNTAMNTGVVVGLPAFDFRVLAEANVAPGSYVVGIACTQHGRPTTAWQGTIDLSADASDQPAHLRWTVEPTAMGKTASGATATSAASSSPVTSSSSQTATSVSALVSTQTSIVDTSATTAASVQARAALPQTGGASSASSASAAWIAAAAFVLLLVVVEWRRRRTRTRVL